MSNTEIGMILLIMLILVRDVVVPLIKGDPVRELAKSISEMAKKWDMNQVKIDDLHKWHSPNDEGVQDWKQNPVCRANQNSIGRLFSVVNDGITDIKGMLSKK